MFYITKTKLTKHFKFQSPAALTKFIQWHDSTVHSLREWFKKKILKWEKKNEKSQTSHNFESELRREKKCEFFHVDQEWCQKPKTVLWAKNMCSKKINFDLNFRHTCSIQFKKKYSFGNKFVEAGFITPI